MTVRKFYTFRVNDLTPDDHLGRLGEITYRDGYLYYHDGSTPGGEIIGGGGSGGPTSWASITNKPSFATVATSGSYADLSNKPSLFSGDYTDLINAPVIDDTSSLSPGDSFILKSADTVSIGHFAAQNITAGPSGIQIAGTGGVTIMGVATAGVTLGGQTSGPITFSSATSGINYNDLSNLPSIPAAQVNADWNEIASESPAYIFNKPSIPSLDGYATEAWVNAQGFGSGAGGFSGDYNDLINQPSIPSLTGYATETYVNNAVSGLVNSAPGALDTLNELAQALGNDANFASSIATQIGNKANTADLAIVATSGSYNDLDNTPTIPTNLSNLNNDIDAITLASIGQFGYITASSLPTSTSQLTNDSGFLTSQTQADWNESATESPAYIWNKPSIPADVADLTDNSNLLGGSGVTNEITNTDGSNTYSVSVSTDGIISMTTARGGIEFGAMPEVGAPSHLHIMRPAGQESSTDLYFGDDYNYVKLPGLYGINSQGVEIGSSYNNGTVSTWKFDTAGHLVPGSDILQDIGTPTNRVRHIYVGPGSITVGNSIITESTTGKLVLPGVTRATTLFANEVEDSGDQTYSFSSLPWITDAYEYSIRSGGTPVGGYVAATYSGNLDDDGYLDDIEVDSGGTWIQDIATINRLNNMYAYIGSDVNETFNASNWVQIPFNVRSKADDVEYEFSSGGGGLENAFTTIEVVGQETIEADGETALTFNAGSGIAIGTSNDNKTITITATGGSSDVPTDISDLTDNNNLLSGTTKSWTNPNNNVWKIEEYSGGWAGGFRHPLITESYSAVEGQENVDYFIINTADYPAAWTAIQNAESYTIEGQTVRATGYSSLGGTTYSISLEPNVSYNLGATITINYRDTNQPPQAEVWWDASNSTSGNNDFRGAIIEYHAYCDRGTTIGKIIIAADDENAVTHTESMSGGSGLAEYEFWYAPNYGQLAVRRVGTSSNNDDNGIMIQWTGKIFYSSDYYC